MTNVEMLRRYIADWEPNAYQGEPYIVGWRTALSNMDWSEYLYGYGICYRDHNGDRCLMLCDVDQLHRSSARAEECLYIVDDGETALPYFVTGWCFFPGQCAEYIADGYVLLRKIHTHKGVGGFGPRRTWHLLIGAAETREG